MKREDAYYFKILLMTGITDGYEEWLDSFLETEESLSELVLNLSFCRSDINQTISYLHSYCEEQNFDSSIVCEKLRLFLKDAYSSGRFSKEETVLYMNRFAVNHGQFNSDLWCSMFYMYDYYCLACDMSIAWERFDCVFDAYINDGTPVDSNKFWSFGKKPKEYLLKKFLSLFFKQ